MFEEEEWTEAVPVDEQIYAVCSAKTKEKSKVISKRRLMQTLQTLGSVPVWDETKLFEDSDEAEGKAPVRVNKTKKRCKKRKKILDADNDGKQNGAVDVAEKLVKKKKPKPKQREPSLDTSLESAKGKSMTEQTQKNSGSPGDVAERRLSRQQWKNKMKNKKRCKNKFSHGLAEVAKVMQQGELLQTQALSKAQNTQSHDLPSGSVRSGEKNGNGVPINAHPSKDAKAITDKKRSITKYLKATVDKPVSKGPKAGNNVCSSPCEPCEQPMPVKGKNNQLQAKKLRHVLNDHVADRHKKLAEEKGEPLNVDNEEGKSPPDRSRALRSRMEKRLESARFRHINEQLYTSTSGEARRMFKQDPDAIGIYHRGYTEQVKHWPVNPVDLIISYIQQKPQSLVVADFGCGDCKIARSVKNTVHCFDLAPVCEFVTACDMARVPLEDCTVDIAVFCLSLMGTNLSDFLAEANRVLQMGGILKIAEVASRFDDVRQFISALSHLGFKLVNKDTDNSHFFAFEFVKVQNAPSHIKKAGLQLRPCLYKKR